MRRSTARDLGATIAVVLRAGTLLAVIGIGAGFALSFVNGSPGSGPTPVLQMLRDGGPDALIGAGLLVLSLTPAAALIAAAVVFERAGERRRAVIACVVLLLLAASLAAAALIQGLI